MQLPDSERRRDVQVRADGLTLPGLLTLPPGTDAVVLFAHGSGSGRTSPRNRYVAGRLNEAGFGTLLFDLLTPAEEPNRDLVFDIDLLGARLLAATRWVRADCGGEGLSIGYFGASTGAAAALWAAADPSNEVGAVVSRGGRPDLAAMLLHRITAPTLLIVGGRDEAVFDLNRRAKEMLHVRSELSVVPDAGHLFEEPGALETVADLAVGWFTEHLLGVGRSPDRRDEGPAAR
jgi:dienelactone hydrolase